MFFLRVLSWFKTHNKTWKEKYQTSDHLWFMDMCSNKKSQDSFGISPQFLQKKQLPAPAPLFTIQSIHQTPSGLVSWNSQQFGEIQRIQFWSLAPHMCLEGTHQRRKIPNLHKVRIGEAHYGRSNKSPITKGSVCSTHKIWSKQRSRCIFNVRMNPGEMLVHHFGSKY